MIETVTTTFKLRLILNESERKSLIAVAEQYTAACNYVSEYVYRNRQFAFRKLHDALYRVLRSQFDLKSQMAQSVIRTVPAKYRSIKSNGHKLRLIRFGVPQCELVWNRDWSIVPEGLSVNTLDRRIRVGYFSEGNSFDEIVSSTAYKFGTARFVFDKAGRCFLHIPVTRAVEIPEPYDVPVVVGIDRGIRKVAVTYDGAQTVMYSGRGIKHKRAKYAAVRKSLQQRGTPSARRRLKRIGHRENGWMCDVNHCISKALVTSRPVGTLFVLEDLKGIRCATERVRAKDRYVSVSWSYYDLEQKLSYKAALAGQRVVKVDPSYTSQRCPVCGKIDSHSRNKQKHFYCCSGCGYRSDDDRIGAMNLYQLGLEYLCGNETPCIQSSSGRPDDGGCSQSPCDATPHRKATKGRRPKAVCTSGQLQASGLSARAKQARDFGHE